MAVIQGQWEDLMEERTHVLDEYFRLYRVAAASGVAGVVEYHPFRNLISHDFTPTLRAIGIRLAELKDTACLALTANNIASLRRVIESYT